MENWVSFGKSILNCLGALSRFLIVIMLIVFILSMIIAVTIYMVEYLRAKYGYLVGKCNIFTKTYMLLSSVISIVLYIHTLYVLLIRTLSHNYDHIVLYCVIFVVYFIVENILSYVIFELYNKRIFKDILKTFDNVDENTKKTILQNYNEIRLKVMKHMELSEVAEKSFIYSVMNDRFLWSALYCEIEENTLIEKF